MCEAMKEKIPFSPFLMSFLIENFSFIDGGRGRRTEETMGREGRKTRRNP
jgi:hypothetical protein